jgi:GT2 family glycosyltransferase
MTIQICCITNSFNRRDLIEMALPPLMTSLQALPLRSAVVVFDAGSTDGSQAYVRDMAAKFPDVPIHLLEPSPPERRSFADGCNQAISHAQRTFPDLKWCFFYETDNRLSNPHALAGAVQFLDAHPSIGGTGFTVEQSSGQKTGYGCRFPSTLSFVLGQKLAARFHLDGPSSHDWQTTPSGQRWQFCDVVFTSPLLIRLQAWKEAGPMDAEVFPFTDSDLEWCWRAKQKGWDMAVLDLPGVIHDNAGSLSNWSARRVLWFHQSRMRLLRQIHPLKAFVVRPLLLARHLVEILLLSVTAIRSPQARRSIPTRLKLLKGVFSGYESILDV